MDALQEIVLTLWDALRCGDLAGHLRAWRRVVRGEVDGETRVTLTGAVVADAGAPAVPAPAAAQPARRSEPVLNHALSASEGAVRGPA
jgi:hypothetical protein